MRVRTTKQSAAAGEREHWGGSRRGPKGWGQGASGERQVICIKMDVPFPGRLQWSQWMLNRGLVTSTKNKALYLPFSSNTRIPPLTSDDDAMRKDEPGWHVDKGLYLCMCTWEKTWGKVTAFPQKSQVPWGLSQPLQCKGTYICALYCLKVESRAENIHYSLS